MVARVLMEGAEGESSCRGHPVPRRAWEAPVQSRANGKQPPLDLRYSAPAHDVLYRSARYSICPAKSRAKKKKVPPSLAASRSSLPHHHRNLPPPSVVDHPLSSTTPSLVTYTISMAAIHPPTATTAAGGRHHRTEQVPISRELGDVQPIPQAESTGFKKVDTGREPRRWVFFVAGALVHLHLH